MEHLPERQAASWGSVKGAVGDCANQHGLSIMAGPRLPTYVEAGVVHGLHWEQQQWGLGRACRSLTSAPALESNASSLGLQVTHREPDFPSWMTRQP